MRDRFLLPCCIALALVGCGSPGPAPASEAESEADTTPAERPEPPQVPPAEPPPLLEFDAPPTFTSDRPRIRITTSEGVIEAELFADQAPRTVATVLRLAEGAIESERGGERAEHLFYDGLTFHRTIPGFMIQGGCPLGTGSGGPGFRIVDEIDAGSLGLDEATVIVDGQPHPQVRYPQMIQAIRSLLIGPRLRARGVTDTTPRDEVDAALAAVLIELEQVSLADFYRELGYRYRDDSLPDSTPPTRGVLAMANSGPDTNGSQFFINVEDTPHLTGKHTVFGRVVAGMEVVDAISAVPTTAANRPAEPVVIESIRLLEPADLAILMPPAENEPADDPGATSAPEDP